MINIPCLFFFKGCYNQIYLIKSLLVWVLFYCAKDGVFVNASAKYLVEQIFTVGIVFVARASCLLSVHMVGQ